MTHMIKEIWKPLRPYYIKVNLFVIYTFLDLIKARKMDLLEQAYK